MADDRTVGRLAVEVTGETEQLDLAFQTLPSKSLQAGQRTGEQFGKGLQGSMQKAASQMQKTMEGAARSVMARHQKLIQRLQQTVRQQPQFEQAELGFKGPLPAIPDNFDTQSRAALARLEQQFERTVLELREKLARGIIDKEEYSRQGRIAGQEFNKGLIRELDRTRGKLSPKVRRQLVDGFKDLGVEGGFAFGKGLDEGTQRVGKILGGLQQQFADKIADLKAGLVRGDIDRGTFNEQGIAAAREFNQAVVSEMGRLSSKGMLTPAQKQMMVKSLKDVGQEGGLKFGQGLEQGAKRSTRAFRDIIRRNVVDIAIFLFAINRIVGAFRNAAASVGQFFDKAAGIEEITIGFDNLTASAGFSAKAIDTLSTAARHLIPRLELMKQANFALQAGLPVTEEQLANLVTISRRLAEAMGRDATDAFTRLINGIAKGERRILDELGIIASFSAAHRKLAKDLNKTVDELEPQELLQARLNEVVEQGTRAMDLLGEEVFTTGKRWKQFTALRQDFGAMMSVALMETPRLASFLRQIGENAEEAAGTMEKLVDKIAGLTDALIERWMTFTDLIKAMNAPLLNSLKLLGMNIERMDLLAMALSGPVPGFFPQMRKELHILRDEANKFAEERQEERRNEERERRRFAHIRELGGEGQEAAIALQTAEKQQEIEEARVKLRSVEAELLTNIRKLQGEIVEEEEKEIDNNKRLASLKRLRNQSQAELVRIGTAEPEDEDGEDEDLKKRMEDARKEVQNLMFEIRRLREVGVNSFDELTTPVATITQEIIDLDRQMDRLQEIISLVGDESGVLTDRLFALAGQRDALIFERADLMDTPEGQFSQEILKARDNLEEYLKTRRQLSALGVADLPEVSEAFMQQVQSALAASDQIDDLRASIENLEGAYPALAAEAQDLIDDLEEQRQQTLETLEATSEFQDLFDEIAGLKFSFFEGLSPDQAQRAARSLREVGQAAEAARRAEDELRLVKDDKLSTDEDVEKATKRATEAQGKLNLALAAARAIMSDLPQEEYAQFLELLVQFTEEGADGTNELAKTMQGLANIAKGVLRLADAMGELDDQTRKVLEGAIQLAEALPGALSGDPASIAAAIGGAAGLISGLFAEDPAVAERRKAVEDNTMALQRLSEDLEALAELANSLTGEQQAALQELRKRDLDLGEGLSEFLGDDLDRHLDFNPAAGSSKQQFIVDPVQAELDRLNLSLTDLEQVARAADVDIENLIAIMRGAFSQGDFRTAIEEWEALKLAIAEVDLQNLFETLEGRMERLRAEWELFDDEPIERLRDMRREFLEFANLPASFERELAGLDLSSPEGRKRFEQMLGQAFQMMAEEGFDVSQLGGFTPEQFQDFLVNMKGLSDEIEEAADDITAREGSVGILRGFTVEQGDLLLVFQATIVEILRLILVELGGPEEVPFAPGRLSEADEVAREEPILDVLKEILAVLQEMAGIETPETPTGDPEPDTPEEQPRSPEVEPNFSVSATVEDDSMTRAVNDLEASIESLELSAETEATVDIEPLEASLERISDILRESDITSQAHVDGILLAIDRVRMTLLEINPAPQVETLVDIMQGLDLASPTVEVVPMEADALREIAKAVRVPQVGSRAPNMDGVSPPQSPESSVVNNLTVNVTGTRIENVFKGADIERAREIVTGQMSARAIEKVTEERVRKGLFFRGEPG